MGWNGTPLGGLSYTTYVNLGGSVLESEFPRLLALASATLNRVTFGRDTTAYQAQVNQALTIGINSLNENGGFQSESLGSYSYTKQAGGQAAVDSAMVDALAGTGLCYRGLEWKVGRFEG